jgi:hypothetical protein
MRAQKKDGERRIKQVYSGMLGELAANVVIAQNRVVEL